MRSSGWLAVVNGAQPPPSDSSSLTPKGQVKSSQDWRKVFNSCKNQAKARNMNYLFSLGSVFCQTQLQTPTAVEVQGIKIVRIRPYCSCSCDKPPQSGKSRREQSWCFRSFEVGPEIWPSVPLHSWLLGIITAPWPLLLLGLSEQEIIISLHSGHLHLALRIYNQERLVKIWNCAKRFWGTEKTENSQFCCLFLQQKILLQSVILKIVQDCGICEFQVRKWLAAKWWVCRSATTCDDVFRASWHFQDRSPLLDPVLGERGPVTPGLFRSCSRGVMRWTTRTDDARDGGWSPEPRPVTAHQPRRPDCPA